MELDQSTLAAVLGIKSIIASAIFYFLHVSLKRISGIFLWANASLLIGVAILLDNFSIIENPRLASLLYNIPLVGGQVIFLFGTAQFVGRPFKRYALTLMLVVVAVLAITFTLISPDTNMRVLTLSAIYVGANAWMAWILWGFRTAHSTFAYGLAAAIMFIQAAAAAMQALVAVDIYWLDFPAAVIIWINAVATVVLGNWVLFLLVMLYLVEELEGVAERMERERIARDLHDTVLQTFQGFVMKANALLPESEPALKESLRSCLSDAITAIHEGRDKVRTLRGSPSPYADLHDYLRVIGEQEAAPGQQLTLSCTGTVRALDPVVHRELCAIGKEALCNAFRHADARKHEIMVDYGSRALVLTVQDDGKGISFSNSGKQGHWGIRGIEERAKLIHAKSSLRTARGAGTTWRIEVKAALAYAEFGR